MKKRKGTFKGKKRINAVKVEYNGIQFDSLLERDFFIYLESNKEQLNIKEIVCHPTFFILKPFEVTCWKCRGEGKQPSEKTGRPIQCRRCGGTGKKNRQSTEYTPDFMVIHDDGHYDYYDCKGSKFVNERFPIIKKAFEKIMGQELIVVLQDQKTKKWIYK